MAITLAQYKASNENSIDQMVVDQFRSSSYLLDTMLFDDGANVSGSDTWVYAYDRVTTEPTAAVRAVNADYTAQEAVTTKVTVECKILGAKAGIDRTQLGTARYGSRIAFQLGQKIKATTALFTDLFINGDKGGTAEEFDGLGVLVASGSTDVSGAVDLTTSANRTTNYMAFLDTMFSWLGEFDGTPSAMFMNRTMLSIMRGIAIRAGYFTQTEDAFGRMVPMFDGIPMVDLGDKPGTSNPVIPTTAGTPDTTVIYAARFGMDGVHGVAPQGSQAFIRTYIDDELESGAVKNVEVEMVTAVALKHARAAGRLTGIQIAP